MIQHDIINKTYQILEYNKIKEMAADLSISKEGKERLLAMQPLIDADVAKGKLMETGDAKQMLEILHTPPLAMMNHMKEVIEVCKNGLVLTPEQLEDVAVFLSSVKRMQSYLKRGEQSGIGLAYYGRSFLNIEELKEQINLAIVNGQLDNQASSELKSIRKKMEIVSERIKERLEQMVRGKRDYFADSYISMRNGHYVLPVIRAYKHMVPGTVIDVSSSGNTLFIEPDRVAKLEEEMSLLVIREENEIQRILGSLTAMVAEYEAELTTNMDAMVALDVIFAKGKLAIDMDAVMPVVNYDGNIVINEGRHPLLKVSKVVPLTVKLTSSINGIVITGPNTGGKTVALKTVGLLSLMARSGLFVPAKEGTEFTMQDMVLCDIGDGQDIEQNLSTFSAHITSVVVILQSITKDSLVLLDELGSGTDPKEGMGIAIAILEKLRSIGCHFMATTHYPEVKDYAEQAQGIINASMAFDRETLSPLYKLRMNEAGESCALYIARRLGMAPELIQIAKQAAYSGKQSESSIKFTEFDINLKEKESLSEIERIKRKKQREQKKKETDAFIRSFEPGDSVIVAPDKSIGIVFASANEKGEIGVQVKKEKFLVSNKRLTPFLKAGELYPDDYDLSNVFDSATTRKIHKKMGRRNGEGLVIEHKKDELYYKK